MKTQILPIIGLTFALIFISRTAAVSAEVKSADEVPNYAKGENESTEHDILPEPAVPDTQPEQCLSGVVLDTISADMTRLDARNKEISDREIALRAIEDKLDTQLTAIEKTNAALQAKINSITAHANDDLMHLVGMYQTMKPKQAAEIFDSMDPAFAAGFLREMSSDKAGMIMANMDARKSYAISVIIAGRNAKYRNSKS